MDKIDLNAIIKQYSGQDGNVRMVMIEAIRQARILFIKEARIYNKPDCPWAGDYTDYMMITEKSIPEVEQLIV